MPRRQATPERLLVTILFTDIVGSTQLATELGDRGWRQLLSRHHALVRRELKRNGGREVDTAGDGFFATFDQPARAIACARDLIGGLGKVGVQIRAGIHMGEVEVMGSTYRGIAVHIGARVMSQAGPGEVLVSSTVRDLMAGSSVRFADRGEHQLKGVSEPWHLYAVEADPSEAGQPDRAEPEPEEETRRRSRVPLLLGAAVIVLAAALAVVLLATRGGGARTSELVAPGANTLVKIDAASARVAGAVPVGTTPKAVAFGDGALWIVNFDDQTFQQVDPTTGAAGPARALPATPSAIAVGGGFVWVESSLGGTVYRIDPAQAHSAVPILVGTGAQGIAFGDGFLWVTNSHDGRLLRIDPRTDHVKRFFQFPRRSSPTGVAVGSGSVWVAESLNRAIVRIDESSGQVTATVPLLQGEPEELTIGEGFVWATNTSADSVTRIDPGLNLGTTVTDVGNSPTGIAAGGGSVWVANRDDGTVAVIDPGTAHVRTRIALGFSPEGVAVAGGSVWVTLHAR